MAKNWNYIPGQWNFICDSCGQKLKAGVAKKRWDGFRVCPECFETRHPQDFLRSKPDRQVVPWVRPLTTDIFLPVTINLQDTVYIYEDVDWQNNKPPVVNSDSITVTESVTTQGNFFRNIPLGSDTTDGPVNGRPLDFFALNTYFTTFDNTTGTLTLSENVSTAFTYTSTQVDGITLTESMTTFKFISNPLNAVQLNKLSLG